MSSKILHPSIRPMSIRSESFIDTFDRLCAESDKILMTSGYISEESTYYLRKCLEINGFPNFDLVVGMSAFDGFTKGQYDGLVDLNKKQIETQKGLTFVSTTFKFHGKAYSFFKNDSPIATIVGSTNISILGDPQKRQFELDVLIEDKNLIKTVVDTQLELINYSKSIDEYKPEKFISSNTKGLIESFSEGAESEGLEKVTDQELLKYKSSLNRSNSYDLELKCEEKSNLNVFNGAPRGGGKNSKGKFIPRNWLEFEIIVSVNVTRSHGYPTDQKFWVVTDDGWGFECQTHGQNSKNLRSSSSLLILGAWIKGKLVASGHVNFGDFITHDQLKNYGRDYVTLTETASYHNGMRVYFMDFSV